jgi:WD40-like Beta Propeller Repeat
VADPTFERRIGEGLRRIASDARRPYDAAAMSQAIVGGRRGPWIDRRRSAPSLDRGATNPRARRTTVGVALLAAAALVVAAVAIGSNLGPHHQAIGAPVPPTPSSTPSSPVGPSSAAPAELPPSPSPSQLAAPCQLDSPDPNLAGVLPAGPLPVATRPANLPTNDGDLVAGGLGPGGVERFDSTTGQSLGKVLPPFNGSLQVMPNAGAPDGRWLAFREMASCTAVLLVASDGTRVVQIAGDLNVAWAWSPDGRWLALGYLGHMAVLGIAPDGSLVDGRTVWADPLTTHSPFGAAWGPDGTLAFEIGNDVAFLAPGASTPKLVQPPRNVDLLAPLAWTTDGSAVIAKGDVGDSDVGMFRITPAGFSRLPLGPLHLHGGKWLDVPVSIVGDRIVFDAFPDPKSPDTEAVYTIAADGTGLTRLSAPPEGQIETGVTFAAAPDGHQVAVLTSSGEIWAYDLVGRSWHRLIRPSVGIQGVFDWLPRP